MIQCMKMISTFLSWSILIGHNSNLYTITNHLTQHPWLWLVNFWVRWDLYFPRAYLYSMHNTHMRTFFKTCHNFFRVNLFAYLCQNLTSSQYFSYSNNNVREMHIPKWCQGLQNTAMADCIDLIILWVCWNCNIVLSIDILKVWFAILLYVYCNLWPFSWFLPKNAQKWPSFEQNFL